MITVEEYFLEELSKLNLPPNEFVEYMKAFIKERGKSEFQLKLTADVLIRQAKLKSEDIPF